MCLVAGGHALLEGIPGLGKTSMARAFAAAVALSHNRVQFTPDLLPADITGTTVFSQDPAEGLHSEFQAGPVFCNLLLADEINRASPRTQSALLEAMQEGTVTAAGTTYPLPRPFCVLATQNPVELHGTYPLPEAQLDRFMLKLRFGYPSGDELRADRRADQRARRGEDRRRRKRRAAARDGRAGPRGPGRDAGSALHQRPRPGAAAGPRRERRWCATTCGSARAHAPPRR